MSDEEAVQEKLIELLVQSRVELLRREITEITGKQYLFEIRVRPDVTAPVEEEYRTPDYVWVLSNGDTFEYTVRHIHDVKKACYANMCPVAESFSRLSALPQLLWSDREKILEHMRNKEFWPNN